MALSTEQKNRVSSEYKKHDKDTGSVEIQVARLTENINQLTEHFNKFSKDFHSRRGLMKMVNIRRKLLKYLKRNDLGRYRQLVERLGLRETKD